MAWDHHRLLKAQLCPSQSGGLGSRKAAGWRDPSIKTPFLAANKRPGVSAKRLVIPAPTEGCLAAGEIGKRWASGNWLSFVRGAVFAQAPRERCVHLGAGLPPARLSGHGPTASSPHPAPCKPEREGEGPHSPGCWWEAASPSFGAFSPPELPRVPSAWDAANRTARGPTAPPSLLETEDMHSPIKEMKVKEKEAADSLLFPCKWRAGRQP